MTRLDATSQVPRTVDFTSAHDVFISYARVDESTADSLQADLSAASLSTFLDRRSLLVGVDWHAELMTAIAGAATLVAVVSEAWQQSPMCQGELAAARDQGKPVIAYLPNGSQPSTLAHSIPIDTLHAAGAADVVRLVQEALPFGRLQARLELAADIGPSSAGFAGAKGRRDLHEILRTLSAAGYASSKAVTQLRIEIDRAHRRRVIKRAVASLVAAGLAVGALALDRVAGFGHEREVQERRVQESLVLAGRSLEKSSYDAFRLALRAVRKSPTDLATTAARRALAEVPSTRDVATLDVGAQVLGAGVRQDGGIVVLAANGAIFRSQATGSTGRLPVGITDASVALDGGTAIVQDEDGVLAEWDLDTINPLHEIARRVSTFATTSDLSTVAWAADRQVRISGTWDAILSTPRETTALAIRSTDKTIAFLDRSGRVYACQATCRNPALVGAVPTSSQSQIALSPSCYGWDRVTSGPTRCIWWRSGDESGRFARVDSGPNTWVPYDENRFVASRGSGLLDMTSRWLDLMVDDRQHTRFEQVDGPTDAQGQFVDGTTRRMPDGSVVAVAWKTKGLVLARRLPAPLAGTGDPLGEYDGGYLMMDLKEHDDVRTASFYALDQSESRGVGQVPLDTTSDELAGGWDTTKWHTSAKGRTAVLSLPDRSIVWVNGRRVAELPGVSSLALRMDGSRLAAVVEGNLWEWGIDPKGLHRSNRPVWRATDGAQALHVAWLNEQALAFTTSDRVTHLVDHGEERATTTLPTSPIGIAASRSGRYVVVTADRRVYLLDNALNLIATADSQTAWGYAPRLAPDDRSVVFTDLQDGGQHYDSMPNWKALSLPDLRPVGSDQEITYRTVAYVPLADDKLLNSQSGVVDLCRVCGDGTANEVISAIESAAQILGVGEFPQGTVRNVALSTITTVNPTRLTDEDVRRYLDRFVRAVQENMPDTVRDFVDPALLYSFKVGQPLNLDTSDCGIDPSGHGACQGFDSIPGAGCVEMWEIRYVRTPTAIYIYEHDGLGDTC